MRSKLLGILSGGAAIVLGLAPLAAFAATEPTTLGPALAMQPFICDPGATSMFQNAGGHFPLVITLFAPGGEAGAIITVPPGLPTNTVSFQVIPNSQSPSVLNQNNSSIGAIFITGVTSTGGTFGGSTPNSITGNLVKGKNLQYNFNLQNMIDGTSATPGSTITALFIGAYSTPNATVSLDNVIVDGQLVTTKILTLGPSFCF